MAPRKPNVCPASGSTAPSRVGQVVGRSRVTTDSTPLTSTAITKACLSVAVVAFTWSKRGPGAVPAPET